MNPLNDAGEWTEMCVGWGGYGSYQDESRETRYTLTWISSSGWKRYLRFLSRWLSAGTVTGWAARPISPVAHTSQILREVTS